MEYRAPFIDWESDGWREKGRDEGERRTLNLLNFPRKHYPLNTGLICNRVGGRCSESQTNC